MPQRQSRKIIISVLAILTLFLLGTAVYIAVRLQTPDVSVADCAPGQFDSHGCCPLKGETFCSADGQCKNPGQQCSTPSSSSSSAGTTSSGSAGCNNGPTTCQKVDGGSQNTGYRCTCLGNNQYRCTEYNPTACPTTPTNLCPSGVNYAGSCGTDGCAAGQRPNYQCNAGTGAVTRSGCVTDAGCGAGSTSSSGGSTTSSSGGATQSCGGGTWRYSGNCIEVVTGSCNLQRFTGSGCPTTDVNDGTVGSGPGTYCPTPQSGTCQQVDVVDSGQGVCSCNNPSSTPSTTTVSTSTTTQVAYVCNSMTRSPAATTLAANQVVAITVTETSATANSSSNVFIMSGTTVVATGTRVSGPTLSSANNYTHVFNVTVPGSATPGSYTVRYSRTGVSTALETGSCQSSFTVTADAPLLATVSVVKAASTVCVPGGEGSVSYTVTATNNSSVAATLNSVVDTLPAQVTSAAQVQNTNPAASAITADTITWTGPFTLNAGASLVFTYDLEFTADQMAAMTSNQLTNTVVVTYGNENSTASFTLLTVMSCLPDTGLLDEPAGLILVGLLLILVGILVNRSGLLLNMFGANMNSSDATSKLVETLINTEERQQDKFSRSVMAEQEKKYNRKKK